MIGAKTIRMDAGVREDHFSDEQLDYVAHKFRAYCRRAVSFGAKMCTENHWGATRSLEDLKKLIAAVNEKNFGLLLHLGNWQTEDPAQRDRNDLEMISHGSHHIASSTARGDIVFAASEKGKRVDDRKPLSTTNYATVAYS